MNMYAIRAVYLNDVMRSCKLIPQSIIGPFISTALYFFVFGKVVGTQNSTIDGVSYVAYIAPGLIMMSIIMESFSHTAISTFFPKYSGSIYELLSAPASYFEIMIGYVLASTTRAISIGFVIFITSEIFVSFNISHPLTAIAFTILSAIIFSIFGFIAGTWANSFEKIHLIPLFIITPLSFIGGTFYSIKILPPLWKSIALFNPIIYLMNGLRWSFYNISDVSIGVIVSVTLSVLILCLLLVTWVLKTGYHLSE
jgi:ABC-2 type transport system permease protein